MICADHRQMARTGPCQACDAVIQAPLVGFQPWRSGVSLFNMRKADQLGGRKGGQITKELARKSIEVPRMYVRGIRAIEGRRSGRDTAPC